MILVWYGVRIISRYLFPWLLKSFVRKQQRKFYDQQPHKQAPKRKEGEVHIKSKGQKSSKNDDDLGDYVDFEEVSDDP